MVEFFNILLYNVKLVKTIFHEQIFGNTEPANRQVKTFF